MTSVAFLDRDPWATILRVLTIFSFVTFLMAIKANHALLPRRAVLGLVALQFARVTDHVFGAIKSSMTDFLAFEAKEIRVPFYLVEKV